MNVNGNTNVLELIGRAGSLLSDAETALKAIEVAPAEHILAAPEYKVEVKQMIIELPDERKRGQVSRFYGEPKRDPNYLAWFNFPTDEMRLYDRDGPGLTDHDGDDFDDHRCHRLLVERFEGAMQELWDTLGEERFFSEGWHVYAGVFNYRRKRAGNTFSIHSWAAAIDLTAWGSSLITSKCGFSIEGVEIMEKWGFLWGPRAWGLPGQCENKKYPGMYFDAMHFQGAIPYLNANSYYAKVGLPDNIRVWEG